MEEHSVIGKRLCNVDALEKITGKAEYGTDIKLPGMLYGKILRSPYPHARILNIDTSKAERLAGVKAVVTAEDTPKTCYGVSWWVPVDDEQLLAIDKVRYIGEEVAAVAAINEDVAEEALDLIKVDYEELPAVFNPEEAAQEKAPKIHDSGNVTDAISLGKGDLDRGFKEADYIFEDRFVTQYQSHCHLEPTDCVARWDVTGKLTVWITSMCPRTMRHTMAKALNIKESNIRIIQPVIGGAFGHKVIMPRLYPICAVLARKAGKPVRLVHTREEDISCGSPRVPMIIELKTGVKRDGTLIARHISIIADTGAYIGETGGILSFAGFIPLNLYKCPNFQFDGKVVYTNKTNSGIFRGYGAPQGMFACESQMDMIAEKLGLDPMELRLRNVVEPGDETLLGWKIGSCGLRECIRNVSEYVKWAEKRREKELNYGIGFACTMFVCDIKEYEFNGETVFVKINEDGRIRVSTGLTDFGQGSRTVFAQIAAEELGATIDDVDLSPIDTDEIINSLGPWGDRFTFSGGNAVRLAAIDARRQLFEIASGMLEVSANDLAIKDGRIFVKGSPDRYVSVAEVAKENIYVREGSEIISKGVDKKNIDFVDLETGIGNVSTAYTFAAQIAEVKVDPETGQVEIINFVTANDIGKAINPMMAEGQAESSVVQHAGFALMEGLRFDGGKVMNPSFLEYKIPTALDAPPVKVFLVETNEPYGPYGAKGAGEPSTIPTAAALANAIYNAVGIRIKDLPITPDKILRALKRD